MQRKELINQLNILQSPKTTRAKKNVVYDIVFKIRKELSLKPSAYDALGFNLLHWAVLSELIPECVSYLINADKIDVNAGTTYVKKADTYNFTPLHFAVENENEVLIELLLKKGANKNSKRICVQERSDSPSVLTYELNETTSEYAFRKGNAAFKPFEKALASDFRVTLEHDTREYDSCLPNMVASFFYYSKTQLLQAERAYEKLLEEEKTTDPVAWATKFKQLKNTHPAIDEDDELRAIYSTGLKARNIK